MLDIANRAKARETVREDQDTLFILKDIRRKAVDLYLDLDLIIRRLETEPDHQDKTP